MKKSIFLIFLTLTIFTLSMWSDKITAPVSRFGGEQLVNPKDLLAIDGEIFVTERQLHRIVIFNSEGEFKMNLGRPGEGPGEFKSLYSVDITKGMIYCNDIMGRRIHLFSQKDKKLLKFIPLTNTVYGHPPVAMAIHTDSRIVVFNNGLTKEDTLISLYTPEGELIKRFFNAYPAYKSIDEYLAYSKSHKYPKVARFKNSGFIGVSEGKIYYVNEIENKVIEMDMDGRILNRFFFPLPSHEKSVIFYTVKGLNYNGNVYFTKNMLNYELRSRNKSIYILSRHDGISYVFRLVKGKFREVCRMKEPLISFDIMNNKIYGLTDEPEDDENEEENNRILVYDIPGN